MFCDYFKKYYDFLITENGNRTIIPSKNSFIKGCCSFKR